MNRYHICFEQLAKQKEGAFIPFVTLGDPSLTVTASILETLVTAGADALEVGLPFSDPLADGPTIQSANLRALQANTHIMDCFAVLKTFRAHHSTIPIGLLVYANLVFCNGIDNFYKHCANSGVDSVLIADVPLHESSPFRKAAEKYHILPIFICPPNADEQCITNIATYGKGYTYLVSRSGVTGTENRATISLSHMIEQLKVAGAPPAIQGFGIAEPEQVTAVIASGAQGVISGSATVKIIEKYKNDTATMLQALTQFVQQMKAVTKKLHDK